MDGERSADVRSRLDRQMEVAARANCVDRGSITINLAPRFYFRTCVRDEPRCGGFPHRNQLPRRVLVDDHAILP